ncbi:MAG: hypothetical protein GY749_25145 [Desulfobacteraceae bacterium]|nr:hypothetical protein [Desulfobacteraceae bacterium]
MNKIIFIDFHSEKIFDSESVSLDTDFINNLAKSLSEKAPTARGGIKDHAGFYFDISMLGGRCNFHLGHKGTMFFWGGAAYDKKHAKDLFSQLLFSFEQMWKRKSHIKLPGTIPVIMGYLTPQEQFKEMPEWLPEYIVHFGLALYKT